MCGPSLVDLRLIFLSHAPTIRPLLAGVNSRVVVHARLWLRHQKIHLDVQIGQTQHVAIFEWVRFEGF